MKKSKATEALRVASESAVRMAALKQRGYRIHKQPKQAVWKVFAPSNPPKTKASPNSRPLARAGEVRQETREFYLLTYQPAPISAWVLHPQNDDRARQAIETIERLSQLYEQRKSLNRRSKDKLLRDYHTGHLEQSTL